MKIELSSPLPAPTELNTDPLLGEAGYRVQTAISAGPCAGGPPDTCPAGQKIRPFSTICDPCP